MRRIGVYGSAGDTIAAQRDVAARLGRELGRRNVVVITGACAGLPYAAAHAAGAAGAEVWGFSPTPDHASHRRFHPEGDPSIYARLIHVPRDFAFAGELEIAKKYRNVVSTAECDAGIVLGGRWGTLHEVCSLLDFGRPVGALTGTGGVADELLELAGRLAPDSRAQIVACRDPAELVDRLLALVA